MSQDSILPAAFAAPDSPFLPGSNVQFAWDSVSLSSILSCPRRYQYQIIDGMVSSNPNFAIALVFGIQFHSGLQYYHENKAAGQDHETAMLNMVKRLLAEDATQSLPRDSDVEALASAQPDPDEAEDDGINLRNSKIRTVYYLFRALIWYLDQYEEDAFKTLIGLTGKPAVETSFRVPLPIDIEGTDLILCGHIDRAIDFNDKLYVSDYKTTKSLTRQFFDMFDLSHQMSGYNLAGQIIFKEPVKGIIVDGIALQVGQVKFHRHTTSRTAGQIDEYLKLLQHASRLAIAYAEQDYYPMNTASCYFCEFKTACRQPPEYRDRFLKMHWKQEPGWNPLRNR